MNTRGIKIAIGDADALIALLYKDDLLHESATSVSQKLLWLNIDTIFPNTAILEAITTLQRKLSNPSLALFLKKQYENDVLAVDFVDDKVMKKASLLFDPQKSKHNTIFDAIVAASAEKFSTELLFSFDQWYKKIGLKLAFEELKGASNTQS
jgi:predicted nucleic acid-binding protein